MEDVRLILGDCLDVLKTLESGSVDAVVTDPPYPSEFNHIWEVLARESARVLKDRGNLVTLLGHYQLPLVLDAFKPHLRYWWIGGMYHGGRRTKIFGKRVCVFWKPCLWFVKGKRRIDLPDMPMDMTKPDGNSKTLHPWQQPLPWVEHWIDRLTLPDEIVLDPFMGSGTTGVACLNTGRRFVGIEKDEGYYAIAQKRIAEAQVACPLFAGADK